MLGVLTATGFVIISRSFQWTKLENIYAVQILYFHSNTEIRILLNLFPVTFMSAFFQTECPSFSKIQELIRLEFPMIIYVLYFILPAQQSQKNSTNTTIANMITEDNSKKICICPPHCPLNCCSCAILIFSDHKAIAYCTLSL